VAKGGELRAQKRCGSKPPLTAPQSHAYSTSNPRAARSIPLGIEPRPDPEENSVNERGLVVETSFHSINRRHGSSGRGDITVSPRYLDGWFLLAGPSELASDRRIHTQSDRRMHR
jgi:hypothetical protein